MKKNLQEIAANFFAKVFV